MGALGRAKDCCCFLILMYGIIVLHGIGVHWFDTFNDVDIYTIQDPNFWGPVTLLIPTNCTWFRELRNSQSSQPADMAGMAARNMTPSWHSSKLPVEVSLLGHPILPEGVTRHHIVQMVHIERCGYDVSAEDPTTFQWWVACMETARSSYANIDGLHSSRMRFFWFFTISFVITSFGNMVKSQVQPTQNWSEWGTWLNAGTRFVSQKMSSYQMQLQLCSLFVTFWDEDHFVMSYFPGMAYVLLMFSAVIIAMGPVVVLETDYPMMVIGVWSVCAFCNFIVVFLPIFVFFPWFILNFLWVAFVRSSSLKHYEIYMQANWPGLEEMGKVSKAMFGANIVEIAMAMGIACLEGAQALSCHACCKPGQKNCRRRW